MPRTDSHKTKHSRRLRWTGFRIFISGMLLTVSVAFMIYVLIPFIEGFIEPQNFANLLFVLLHVFYMFNIMTLETKKQWVFWVMSYVLVDAASIVFIFYDTLFFWKNKINYTFGIYSRKIGKLKYEMIKRIMRILKNMPLRTGHTMDYTIRGLWKYIINLSVV